MQTSAKRTGALLSLISLFLGSICVLRAPSSLGMSPTHSFALLYPQLLQLLIQLQLLLAQLTFTMIALQLFSALADSHPDRDIWLTSYREERGPWISQYFSRDYTWWVYRSQRKRSTTCHPNNVCLDHQDRQELTSSSGQVSDCCFRKSLEPYFVKVWQICRLAPRGLTLVSGQPSCLTL